MATRFTPAPAPDPVAARPAPVPMPAPVAAGPPRVANPPGLVSLPPAPPAFSPPPAPVSTAPVPIAVSHPAAGPVAPPTTPPPASGGLVWRAVATPPPTSARPRIEIVPTGTEPNPLPASVMMSTRQLQGIVREQCGNWVRDVEVSTAGAGKVVVEFAAFSESHAHAAAEAVSRVPELRGFEVSFVARIAKP